MKPILAAAAFVLSFGLNNSLAGSEPMRVDITKRADEKIGQHDYLILVVLHDGKELVRETLLSDSDVTVYLPKLGRLSVTGMTPARASNLATRKYQKIWPSCIASLEYQSTYRNLALDKK